MNICIFEDEEVKNLYPLALSRPVYDLRCGIYTLAEKIKLRVPLARISYHSRIYLRSIVKRDRRKLMNNTHGVGSCIFINGRIMATDTLIKKVTSIAADTLLYNNQRLIAAHLSKENLHLVDFGDSLKLKSNSLKRVAIKSNLIQYPWDLVKRNTEEIFTDATFKHIIGEVRGTLYEHVDLINKKNIHISLGAKIKSGTVLDAEQGPIIIDRGALIEPNCVITGPVYIGVKVKVNAGARIGNGTSIGLASKVGGEISESIIHSHSNKQHDGFLGHSYIGSWCNLGADTNNSDLKNNYSSVETIINGKKINTGEQFVGLFMGDHTKTGINTMFNTGTVVGVGCNVYGAGYLPKYIPSFSWSDAAGKSTKYDFNKFCATARAVCARRSITFTQSDIKLYKEIFNTTKVERSKK